VNSLRHTLFRLSLVTAHSSLFSWWTGEDSNPRSSQGAAGLQPAAIDRSATCPHHPQFRRAAKIHHSCCRSYAGPLSWVIRVDDRHEGRPSPRTCVHQKPECTRSRIPNSLLAAPLVGSIIWSWRRDSNPRPSDYKSDALPAELRQPPQTTNYRDGEAKLQGETSYFSAPRNLPPDCKISLFFPMFLAFPANAQGLGADVLPGCEAAFALLLPDLWGFAAVCLGFAA
jgi:hypothetical protein